MKRANKADRREILKAAGLFAAGAVSWTEAAFQGLAAADEKAPAANAAIGRREIIKGLDGMSRAADPGADPFGTGHTAAAVISSAFFCREQKIDGETQKGILSLVEARLLTRPVFAPRPEEAADPTLVDGLVKDLDAGIDTLRRSGHNIIFAVVSLKALREVPEAVTPERVQGLRKTIQSFGARRPAGTPRGKKDGLVDLGDEPAFIRFALEEYLKALELYRNGKGHHGFAGHLLTVAHALVELGRMGYKETAQKGVEAYWQFVEQARDGADLGGQKVPAPAKRPPTPLDRDYWLGQGKRSTGPIVSSHLIKYPYSFYALAKKLPDDDLKQRIRESIPLLTAVS